MYVSTKSAKSEKAQCVDYRRVCVRAESSPPRYAEMSVDYKLCAGTQLTVVVTNYETDCCKNWYVHRKNVPFQVQQYVSRLQSAVSVIPL